jgi:hypothetical protein
LAAEVGDGGFEGGGVGGLGFGVIDEFADLAVMGGDGSGEGGSVSAALSRSRNAAVK